MDRPTSAGWFERFHNAFNRGFDRFRNAYIYVLNGVLSSHVIVIGRGALRPRRRRRPDDV